MPIVFHFSLGLKIFTTFKDANSYNCVHGIRVSIKQLIISFFLAFELKFVQQFTSSNTPDIWSSYIQVYTDINWHVKKHNPAMHRVIMLLVYAVVCPMWDCHTNITHQYSHLSVHLHNSKIKCSVVIQQLQLFFKLT